MGARILIVEDEADLAETLRYNLEQEGYEAKVAGSAGAALEVLAGAPLPDLVLLDLMLPDLSGLELCRRLRREPRTEQVPVIMLTARGEEVDRVVGFEVGADDYVVKPFSVRELLLRVAAVLRRAQARDAAETGATRLAFGRLVLDADAHQVWVDGGEVHLTALEFRLLHTLLGRRGRVQTRERLLEDVWGYAPEVTTRTVDTHVRRLREKLGDAGAYVETVRGVGYRFRATPEEREP